MSNEKIELNDAYHEEMHAQIKKIHSTNCDYVNADVLHRYIDEIYMAAKSNHIPDTGKMVAVDENRNDRGEPDAIYLQIHGEEYEQRAPDYCGEVSWCSHKIQNADVRYIREDLAATSDHIAEVGKMIESPILRFINAAEQLIDHHPYLYVGIARTRTTDWMAILRKSPNGELIAESGQGLSAEEACAQLLNNMGINHSVDANKKVVGTLCPEDHTPVSNELIDFLHGKSEFKNCNFGEEARKGHGRFWWRKYLPRGGAQ